MKVLFAYKTSESLGIEYISSVLKENGHKTDLVFDPGAGEQEYELKIIKKHFNFEKDILFKIKRFSPDLIAFSALTPLFPWVKSLSKLIKEEFDIPIIVGGMHPTILPEKTLKYRHIDMICRGEGEFALLDLVNSLESRKENYNIDNIWFKQNGKIIKNPLRTLIQDIDNLPFPDKDLFFKYGAFNIRYVIMSSRGCPYNCTYCHNHQLRKIYNNSKSYVRFRSVDNVIDELKWALKRYKFKSIYFHDDIFGLNYKWLKEFVVKYKREINIPYKCLIRPQNLTEERLRLLKDSKCKYVDVGLESGNPRIRNDIFNRNISDKEMLRNFLLIKKSGIKFSTLNIIGTPSETLKELMDTFNFNYKVKPKGALFSFLYPFPKTKIYEICEEMGEIDDESKEQLAEGLSNLRLSPILKKNAELLERFNVFAPIFLKLPSFFTKYMLRIPPIKLFRLLSIFFINAPRTVMLRILEYFIMLFRTIDYYNTIRTQ